MKKEFSTMPFMLYYKESSTYCCTLCNATLNAFSQIAAHIAGNFEIITEFHRPIWIYNVGKTGFYEQI